MVHLKTASTPEPVEKIQDIILEDRCFTKCEPLEYLRERK